MKCIYLDNIGFCKAVPSHVSAEYKPDDDTLKNFCTSITEVRSCPRLQAYHDYLEALRKEKK